MQISLLREFIVLSKNLNFSQTAQKLHISQSVLSKHIAFIEKQLGTDLFTRNRQSVKLTPIGELFLEDAIDIVKKYDEALDRINIALDKAVHELRIGYLDAHTRALLVSTVQMFEMRFPKYKLSLMTYEYAELTQQLKYKNADIIFTLDFDNDIYSWCNVYRIYKDILCVVVRHDHPFAKLADVDLLRLTAENTILPDPEHFTDYAAFIDKIFEAEGLSGTVVERYPHVNSSLLMVEIGKGVSILPGRLAFNANEKFVSCPLKEADLSLT